LKHPSGRCIDCGQRMSEGEVAKLPAQDLFGHALLDHGPVHSVDMPQPVYFIKRVNLFYRK
jgi:hypothetical protein